MVAKGRRTSPNTSISELVPSCTSILDDQPEPSAQHIKLINPLRPPTLCKFAFLSIATTDHSISLCLPQTLLENIQYSTCHAMLTATWYHHRAVSILTANSGVLKILGSNLHADSIPTVVGESRHGLSLLHGEPIKAAVGYKSSTLVIIKVAAFLFQIHHILAIAIQERSRSGRTRPIIVMGVGIPRGGRNL